MPDRVLDVADRRILGILQNEGRISNLDLAERVGLSPSPCLRRVRALEEDGFIEGYRAQLDRRMLGLSVMAYLLVRLERHSEIEFEQQRSAILALPEVIACHVVSGEFDLFLHVLTKTLDEFRDFIMERMHTVPGLRDIRTCFVIDTITERSLSLGCMNSGK